MTIHQAQRAKPRHGLAKLLLARAGGRLAALYLLGLVLLALSADFIASDLPLLLSRGGEVYVLPNLLEPAALRGQSIDSLVVSLGDDDWLLATPIPFGPNQQDRGHAALSPPSARHWLGTDGARRDVLARLIHGSRVTLLVGVVSVSLLVCIGTLLGLLAGYYAGWVDTAVSRLVDAILAMPVFFLVLAVMGVVEGAGIGTMMCVIGLVSWTSVARLVRAETLRLLAMDFVAAAQGLGFSTARVLFRHVLPNAMAPVLVAATFGMAGAVLVEASLSFLGFGTPDGTASWGGLLRGAMGHVHAWWLVVFPGAAVFVTVMAYNVVGEVLRDGMDPHGRLE